MFAVEVEMSNSIYILTEGNYSDYHIIGAYSTEELAKEAQSLYPDAEIEEYGLDYIPEYPPGMTAWHVHLSDNEITYTYQTNPFSDNVPKEIYYDRRGEKGCVYYLWAVDKEHAEKIALDKWYQHQAQEAGIA
jgi:hypothetical protein